MTIQFHHRTENTDAAGCSVVYLIAHFNQQRLRMSTNEKCLPSQWDAKRQQFRRSYPGFQEANELLASLSARVVEAHRKQRAEGLTPTPTSLKAALGPAPMPVVLEQNVVLLMNEFRAVLRGRGYMRETLRHYLVSNNWLRDFAEHRGRKLQAEAYTLQDHDALLHYLTLTRKLAPNSVYTLVKNLKALLKDLRDERGYKLSVDVRQIKATYAEVDKVYLTAAELTQLQTAVLPANLVPVRDVFLFCYTGLRYSDVYDLHGGNVSGWDGGHVLRLTQSKTRRPVSIYLTEAARGILDKYAGERAKLLPVYQNQVMNRYLKRICRLGGVSSAVEVVEVRAGRVEKRMEAKHELVTMHTARHTFATQSLLRGMPVEVLQKRLGHASIKTTLIYAKIVEDFQHQTMRRIWEGGQYDNDAGASSTICAVEPAA
ncbi:site-specific integrase [Hymenobacter cellulosivorans]|uniref:Tyrosine-type recombinase/integrase n=1 Tax=Hymenobacter cellulosivorans TaxID=2932249 RepID=A0ABY4F513_9BACT|nr:site-specific integrase [Hymenobacter cellulosivorans]UOQ51760.1 tyrosine-type recombinase/integrase [Hymenobacter cellulosivorans]